MTSLKKNLLFGFPCLVWKGGQSGLFGGGEGAWPGSCDSPTSSPNLGLRVRWLNQLLPGSRMRSTALFIALLALLVTGLMAQDNAEGRYHTEC